MGDVLGAGEGGGAAQVVVDEADEPSFTFDGASDAPFLMGNRVAVLVDELELDVGEVLAVGGECGAVGGGFECHGVGGGAEGVVGDGVGVVDASCLDGAGGVGYVPDDGVIGEVGSLLHAHHLAVDGKLYTVAVGHGLHLHDEPLVVGGKVPDAGQSGPLPEVTAMVDVEAVVADGNAHHGLLLLPDGTVPDALCLFCAGEVDESRGPSA